MSIQTKIQEWHTTVVEWSRIYRREIIFATIIFFTAFISFGAGYLANRELNHAQIIIEQCNVSDSFIDI